MIIQRPGKFPSPKHIPLSSILEYSIDKGIDMDYNQRVYNIKQYFSTELMDNPIEFYYDLEILQNED